MRILVIEDEDQISADLTQALTSAGYVVDVERDGTKALRLGLTQDYSAIILDLGLPNMDGLSVLRQWRAEGRAVPVLVLTARGDWIDRVTGIDAGADDYLSKPFQMEEVLARLRAILRRSVGQSGTQITLGPLTLNARQMQISLDGVALKLTPQEYRLLTYLMHHAGRVVSHAELLEQLYSDDLDQTSNAIEVLIGRVRRKLKADLIQTRRGFGYIIDRPGL